MALTLSDACDPPGRGRPPHLAARARLGIALPPIVRAVEALAVALVIDGEAMPAGDAVVLLLVRPTAAGAPYRPGGGARGL